MPDWLVTVLIAVLGGAATFVSLSWRFGAEDSKKAEKIMQLETSSALKTAKLEELSTKVTVLERDLHNLKNNIQVDFARSSTEWAKLEVSMEAVKEMVQGLMVSMAEIKAAVRGEESKANRRPG